LQVLPDGLYVHTNRNTKQHDKSKGKGKGGSNSGSQGRHHADVDDSSETQMDLHRVSTVIIDAEICDIDPKNPTIKKKAILEEARYWVDFHHEQIQKLSHKLEKKLEKNQAKGKPGVHQQPVFQESLSRLNQKIAQQQADADILEHLISAYQLSRSHQEFKRLRKHLKRTKKRDLSDMLNQGVPGLLDLYFQGGVDMVNGPGFDFLGDKQFCMYVDRLIRFYLNEEPVLQSIPTLSFAEHDTEELLAAIFDDPHTQDSVVIKRVDGRGGDAVWVGPMISAEEFIEVRAQIRNEPNAFLVQKYIALSRMDGQLTDLRNLASVTRDSIVVSKTLWARGVPAEGGNGKVNISDAGFELTVCTATADNGVVSSPKL
jgi:hypothetical protein